MKIALYIEDGTEQIVLTGESETERLMLAKLHNNTRELTVMQGAFYACQGGWTRHRSVPSFWDQNRQPDSSTILVLREKPPTPPLTDHGPISECAATKTGEF